MVAHRYWRITDMAAIGSGSNIQIGELELRTAYGGDDVTGSGVAIGSSGTPSAAFNNSYTSEWDAGNNSPTSWVGYDFGAGNDKDVIEVQIQAGDTVALNRSPSRLTVQWSDDAVTWNYAWRSYHRTWSTGSITVFPKPVCSYRITIHSVTGSGSDICEVAELELIEGGANKSPSGIAIQVGGTRDSGLIDASISTTGQIAAGGSWIVDFKSAVEADEIAFQLSSLQLPGRGPDAFKVDRSEDQWQTWATVYDHTDPQAAWTAGERRVYSMAPPATRRTPMIQTF